MLFCKNHHNFAFSFFVIFVCCLDGYRVMIVDPEIIRSVAVTNCQKFARSDFVTKVIPSIEKALFAVNGRVHARQRRMIGPAFNSSNLRGFLDVFKENAEKLLQVIKQLYIYIKKQVLAKITLFIGGNKRSL